MNGDEDEQVTPPFLQRRQEDQPVRPPFLDREDEAVRPPFLEAKKEIEPKDQLTGAAREVAHGILPAAAALRGMGVGARVGAAIPIPHPLGRLAATAVGGLAGGAIAGIAASTGQEWLLNKMGISDEEQRQAYERKYPITAELARAAPMAAAFRPSFVGGAAQVAKRALMTGGAMAGLDAGTQLALTGQLDPTRLAVSAATGAVFNQPRAWTERLMGIPAAAPAPPAAPERLALP